MDEERRPLRSTRARRAVEVLRTSLDGGETSSYYGLLDLLWDMATYGNALAVPVFGVAGRLTRLNRIKGATARWEETTRRYRGEYVGSRQQDVFSPREVIHSRWGGRRSPNDRLGVSPLRVLARSVNLGAETEEAILREVGLGPESRAIITAAPSTVALGGDVARFPDDSQKGEDDAFGSREHGRVQTVRRAAVIEAFPETPVEKQQMKLLAHMVGQVAQFYGVPSALMNIGASATSEDFKNLRRLGVLPLVNKFLEAAQVQLLRPGAKFRVNSVAWEFEDAEGRAALMDRIMPNTGRMPVGTIDEVREIGSLGPATPETMAEIERLWEMMREPESPEGRVEPPGEPTDGTEE